MKSKQLKHIVILENNRGARERLRQCVSDTGHIPFCFEKKAICLDNLALLQPDLVIVGNLSRSLAIAFVNAVKLRDMNQSVLLISDDRRIELDIAVEPYSDVVCLRPRYSIKDIQALIEQVPINGSALRSSQHTPLIVGGSPGILRIKKILPQLITTRCSVIIRGEKGVGKSHLARYLHSKICLPDTPFTTLAAGNAAGGTVSNSELFDFSTIRLDQQALDFERINTADLTGTVFLENIDEMPAQSQSALLYVLETICKKEGLNGAEQSGEPYFIASTSTDVNHLLTSNGFRKDVLYRLNVLNLEIPPLRDRLEDLPLLAHYFLDKFCLEHNLCHLELPSRLLTKLAGYQWPGNLSEFQRTIQCFVDNRNAGTKSDIFDFGGQCLPLTSELNWQIVIDRRMADMESPSLKKIRTEIVDRIEYDFIRQALKHAEGNRKKAAKLLDISYKSLLNKMHAMASANGRI